MRARASHSRQKRVVASSCSFACSSVVGPGQALVPRERAEQRLSALERVARAGAAALDPEQHVGLQPDRLVGAGRLRAVAVVGDRPLGRNAAVVERRLAHEVDLDAAVDAAGRAHEHVLGVLVGRRPRMRRDRVLAAARSHRQRVAHDHPPVGVFHEVTSVFVPGS